jgi:hypothetical protein
MAHPLSPEEPSTTRRIRIGAASQRHTANYFDLKRDSDARITAGTTSNAFVDDELGTVAPWPTMDPGNATIRCAPSASAALGMIKDGDKLLNPQLALALSPNASQVQARPSSAPLAAKEIIITSWHTLDDAAIDSSLATSTALRHALRVISRALEDINARYAEMKAIRQRESNAEQRARQRVKKIMWDLDDEQKVVARTVMDAIFTEAAEEVLAVPVDDGVDGVSLYVPIIY